METKLKELLEKAFPQAIIMTSYRTQKGFWVDITFEGKKACVEYRKDKGFGVSRIDGSAGFGEGHDMVTEDVESVTGLLKTAFDK